MRDLRALVYSKDNLEAGLTPEYFLVDGNPDAIVEAPDGSIAVDPEAGLLYLKTDEDDTSWSLGGGGGGGGTVIQTTEGLSAGASNNYALLPGVSFLDCQPNAAGSTLTGLVAGVDGTEVTVTNILAVNALTLASLTGSALANQFRLPADITLFQYDHITFRYVASLAKWVPV